MAPWSRCRLVVMANEVGGRWSPEALAFLRQLAKAKARNEAAVDAASGTTGEEDEMCWPLCRVQRPGQCRARCWNFGGHGGADGVVHMTHEVEADFRHAPLG